MLPGTSIIGEKQSLVSAGYGSTNSISDVAKVHFGAIAAVDQRATIGQQRTPIAFFKEIATLKFS